MIDLPSGYDIHSSPWFFDGPNRNPGGIQAFGASKSFSFLCSTHSRPCKGPGRVLQQQDVQKNHSLLGEKLEHLQETMGKTGVLPSGKLT